MTTYSNVEEGQLVIFAPEGSTVNGKEVKRQKVAGDWVDGVLCGPMEMGWPGNASECVLLSDAYAVGSFAPASPKGLKTGGASAPAAAADDDEPAGADEDSDD